MDAVSSTILTRKDKHEMAEIFLHGAEVLDIEAGPRPIQTLRSSVIGIVGTAPSADAAAFPLNTPVLVAGSRTLAAKLDTLATGLGTLPDAMDSIFDQGGAVVVVIRVAEGADAAATLVNVLGGVNAATGQYEGVHALLGAESQLGVKPRILLAPGFTHQRTNDTANAVVAELVGIADRMRAIICQDGPDTTDADAQAAAGDFGSKRIYLCDPGVKKVDKAGQIVTRYNSPVVAGVIARTDNELGFWVSPSNKQINGIVGTTRPVDFAMGDANSRANLLNERNVATIIRQDGFRLWGNRTLSDDPKWQFLCVVRTADMINDSLLAAHLWAVDRGITRTYLTDVQEGVRNYLRFLVAIGAIIGGDCWLDPELNTPENIAAGRAFWDFDFTPTYPAEHLQFRSHLVNDYLTEII